MVLDRLDDLVTVPRLFADQVQDDQAKITMRKEPPKSRAPAPLMPPMVGGLLTR
jgi:hypothetical protein